MQEKGDANPHNLLISDTNLFEVSIGKGMMMHHVSLLTVMGDAPICRSGNHFLLKEKLPCSSL